MSGMSDDQSSSSNNSDVDYQTCDECGETGAPRAASPSSSSSEDGRDWLDYHHTSDEEDEELGVPGAAPAVSIKKETRQFVTRSITGSDKGTLVQLNVRVEKATNVNQSFGGSQIISKTATFHEEGKKSSSTTADIINKELNRLIDARIQEKYEENERHRRESEAQINELAKRMEDLETQKREEQIQHQRERERLEATLRQVLADHRDEINALKERYEQNRNAILDDLDNLRREKVNLTQQNRDYQSRIADLTRQLNQRDNFIAGETIEINAKDEIMIAELASGLFSGVLGLTSMFIGTLPLTVILLGAAAALTADGLRRWWNQSQPPHYHQD